MERRKFPRAETSAIAHMQRTRDRMGPVQVELRNLSASGALLLSAGLDLEDTVRLDIRIPGLRPLRLDARVVRRERQGELQSTAVAFEDVPPDTEDAIQDWVLAQLETSRSATEEAS